MKGELRELLLVVVLVLSCVAGGACIPGTILSQTLLQAAPGHQGQTIHTTLLQGNVVDVDCRTQDALVYDDPWWLHSTYTMPDGNGNTTTGWVADYYVDCGNVGNCNVKFCA